MRTLIVILTICLAGTAAAAQIELAALIDEALANNPEIRAAGDRIEAAARRIPQVGSLPDPMFMTGYQDEGLRQFNYGDSPDAQWMLGVSQMFPYPGKRGLKAEMAGQDVEALKAAADEVRIRTMERIKDLYLDLFLAYKNLDIIEGLRFLYKRVEDAALARYSSGMGMQQEVLMAQRERYMLLEREEMTKSRLRASEAMLFAALGREPGADPVVGRPAEPPATTLVAGIDELLAVHLAHSPMVREKEAMIRAGEAKMAMAKREYYPDLTVGANYAVRGGGFQDMWSLTTTVNLPIFYRSKQEEGVREAQAAVQSARSDLSATRQMLAATIREGLVMAESAQGLMGLYKEGLIPKAYQDFEAALAGYITARIEAVTVLAALKSVVDADLLYWQQFVEREKAMARVEAAAGIMTPGGRER